MRLFRRYRGMINPRLDYQTLTGSVRIARRKSADLVQYLRARDTGGAMKQFFRKRHLRGIRK